MSWQTSQPSLLVRRIRRRSGVIYSECLCYCSRSLSSYNWCIVTVGFASTVLHLARSTVISLKAVAFSMIRVYPSEMIPWALVHNLIMILQDKVECSSVHQPTAMIFPTDTKKDVNGAGVTSFLQKLSAIRLWCRWRRNLTAKNALVRIPTFSKFTLFNGSTGSEWPFVSCGRRKR